MRPEVATLLSLERVLQPKLTQRHLGLVYLLRRDPVRGGDLYSKRDLQAGGCGEFREHLGIEVHPLLVWDVAAPNETRNARRRLRLTTGYRRCDCTAASHKESRSAGKVGTGGCVKTA